MRILVAGGGSGGHISPIIAITAKLKEKHPKVKIFFAGTKGGIEEKLIPQTGIRFYYLRCGKFSRYHKSLIVNLLNPATLFGNIKGFGNFLLGVKDALKILKETNPDIVFLKGGFVSLPLGIGCVLKGYPYFLHESDAVMGLANKILAKRAVTVFVSFPEKNYPEVSPEKIIYSGNPIRADIIAGDREEGRKIFNFKKSTPTIMVIGGSQGAHAINDLIIEELDHYLEKYQLLHVTGDYDFDFVEYKKKQLPKELAENYRVYNFLTTNINDAYAVSDLVITRAGNNILTELAALSKPAIVIPLNSSANNHQRANATIFSREGAAYLMIQDKITAKDLFRQAELILGNEEERNFLAKKINQFYKPDAVEIIVSKIEEAYQQLTLEEKDGKKSENKAD